MNVLTFLAFLTAVIISFGGNFAVEGLKQRRRTDLDYLKQYRSLDRRRKKRLRPAAGNNNNNNNFDRYSSSYVSSVGPYSSVSHHVSYDDVDNDARVGGVDENGAWSFFAI